MCLYYLSHLPGSNRRPARYECAALPTELRWRISSSGSIRKRLKLVKKCVIVASFDVDQTNRGMVEMGRDLFSVYACYYSERSMVYCQSNF